MRAARSLVSTILALCLLVLSACGGTNVDEAAPDAADSAEAAASASADPLDGITADARVVALTRSLADLWQTAGGSLVGVPDDALDLPELSEDCVSIGSLAEPDAEQIIALEPDLVLMSADLPSQQALCAELAKAGVPVLSIDINSFDDYDAQMAALTEATGRADLYEKNVTAVRGRIDDVIANSAQPDRGSYVMLRVSAERATLLGEGSFVCAMLDDLGLSNAVSAGTEPAEATVASIAEADPDWIFVVFQGDEQEA